MEKSITCCIKNRIKDAILMQMHHYKCIAADSLEAAFCRTGALSLPPDCPKNGHSCPFLGFTSIFLRIFIDIDLTHKEQNTSNYIIFNNKQRFHDLQRDWHTTCI
jgi:hypothetical protein